MQTVGEILRAEREKNNLTIKDVEKETSIRALYLTAIEEGNYHVVPGEVYLKGFIRNYAIFLGLDGPGVVEVYRQEKAPQNVSAQTASPADVISDIGDSLQNNKTVAEKVKERNRSQSSAIKLFFIALIVVVLGGACYWFYFMSKDMADIGISPAKQPTSVVNVPPSKIPTPSSQQQPPVVSPSTSSKPLVLQARFTDTCWISVLSDGKIIYEGIPKLGETITWEAQQNIVIKAGNASGVNIAVNGQDQGMLGDKGDVVERTFTASPSGSPPVKKP